MNNVLLLDDIYDEQLISESDVLCDLLPLYSKKVQMLEYGIYVEQDEESSNKNDVSLQEKIKMMIQRVFDFFKRVIMRIASIFKFGDFKKKNKRIYYYIDILIGEMSDSFTDYANSLGSKFLVLNESFIQDIFEKQKDRILMCYEQMNRNALVYEHSIKYSKKAKDFKIADEHATFNLKKATETENFLKSRYKKSKNVEDFKEICGNDKMFLISNYSHYAWEDDKGNTEHDAFPIVYDIKILDDIAFLVDKLWFIQKKCEKYIKNAKYIEKQYSDEKDTRNVSDYCHYITEFVTVLFKHLKFVTSVQNNMIMSIVFNIGLIPQSEFNKHRIIDEKNGLSQADIENRRRHSPRATVAALQSLISNASGAQISQNNETEETSTEENSSPEHEDGD